ncbi:MAG: hypothetical protein MZV63_05590 [Marinilabiliales bacterium]|nr:hypothetical protein [Marinilabiliales bacterium]
MSEHDKSTVFNPFYILRSAIAAQQRAAVCLTGFPWIAVYPDGCHFALEHRQKRLAVSVTERMGQVEPCFEIDPGIW